MPTRAGIDRLLSERFVARDWVDLRDLVYAPSLAVLRDRLLPDALDFGVRDQGSSGRCVGFALANLVDLQRRLQSRSNGAPQPAAREVVSADMLYWMAAYHEDYPDIDRAARDGLAATATVRPEGVRSLRSGIKALYHHGVCFDWPTGTSPPEPERWQSDCYHDGPPTTHQRFPTVAQAKAARAISLGAYFRLDPILNHYHAALNDTGGILVSARIHEGWRAPFTAGAGVIGDYTFDDLGAHAFVIVGYDAEGFLVLNSWGPGWGGHAGLPGIALWRYADWAETVMDGWVLRLGVSAPEAFDVAVGPQGLARAMGKIRTGTARCHQLIGHYLHLDDGFHVESGAYPSDSSSWPTTLEHLRGVLEDEAGTGAAKAGDTGEGRAAPRRGVLLWIPGSLEGIAPAVESAILRKNEIAGLGLYSYNLFWCNQFVEKSLEVLTHVFDSAHARVGAMGPQLDALIEMQLRGIGRAFWRDMEQGARRAVHGTPDLPEENDECPMPAIGPGPVVALLRDMMALTAAPDRELHVVCEGAGVLVLHELLRYLVVHHPEDYAALPDRLTSLSLIHPAIGLPRAGRHLAPLIRRMNAAQPAAMQTPVRIDGRPRRHRTRQAPRARIYLPAPPLEERLCFGVYGGSLLQLVSRSFEDRLAQDADAEADRERPAGPPRAHTHPSHPPRPLLGTNAARAPALERCGAALETAFSELTALEAANSGNGRVPYAALLADPLIPQEVFRTIRELRATKATR